MIGHPFFVRRLRVIRSGRAQKNEVSEVFDAERAPLFVLVTQCATETPLYGYNLPIASTNLKLLT